MNILVAGSNGQLGSEIKVLHKDFSTWNFLFLDLPDIDITNKEMVDAIVSANNIDVIINCAAYTAVDKAESDKELAEKVNVTGTEVLAKVASEKHITLVHVSTDFVFDGKKSFPYTEEDATNSASVYGITKAKGEEAVLSNCSTSLVVRTSWLYSSFGNNFVKTMLKLGSERDELKIIFEQVGTPTYARDLAKVILEILKQNSNGQPKYGIYHYSNEGVASWYDFTKAILDIEQISCRVLPIKAVDYPLPATRPNYSVMDKAKIKKDFNIEIPYWRDSLVECLNILRQNS